MVSADEVRRVFPDGVFETPCSGADILLAEAAIAQKLPKRLVEVYCAFNGFRGPTSAAFLWPLFSNDGTGLVGMNLHFRKLESTPKRIKGFIFFGDAGGGRYCGINPQGDCVILWGPVEGDDFDMVGKTPLDAWRRIKALYERDIL